MVRLRLLCVILLLCSCCHAQLFETKISSGHIRIDQAGPRDYLLEPVILTIEKVDLRFPDRPVEINVGFDTIPDEKFFDPQKVLEKMAQILNAERS